MYDLMYHMQEFWNSERDFTDLSRDCEILSLFCGFLVIQEDSGTLGIFKFLATRISAFFILRDF